MEKGHLLKALRNAPSQDSCVAWSVAVKLKAHQQTLIREGFKAPQLDLVPVRVRGRRALKLKILSKKRLCKQKNNLRFL